MGRMKLPWNDPKGRFNWLKAAALGVAVLPGLVILYWYATGQLGALPTKAAMKLIGLWCIRFLIISMALTPLQRILNWPRLALIRRITGVTAAAYAGIHLMLFIPYSGFDAGKIVSEIALRPYLTIGFAALLGLAALAATSTDAMLARLGQNWKRLHRLVYLIVPLGLLHYAMQAKLDVTAPLQLAAVLLLLMGVRLLISRRIPLTAMNIVLLTLAATGAAAAFEAGWYAFSSGISPGRILAANLSLADGLRPAIACLAAGLLLAAGAAFRQTARRRASAGMLA